MDGIKKILIVIFTAILVLYMYAPATNEYPKGSDSFFHMDSGIKAESGIFSSYPPLYHMLLALLFKMSGNPLLISKFIGAIIAFFSSIAFFLLVKKISSEKISLISTLIYATSIEILNTSAFNAPANLGLLMLFSALLLLAEYYKNGNEKILYISTIIAALLALTHPLSFIMLIFFSGVLYPKKKTLLFAIPVAVFMAFTMSFKSMIIFNNPSFASFLTFPLLTIPFIIAGLLMKNVKIGIIFFILLAWSLLSPIYPERVVTFLIIPASLLAGYGFMKIHKIKFSKFIIIPFLVFALVLPLTFYDTNEEMTKDDYETLLWINTNLPGNATIASTWQVSGAWIPAIADRKNILGAYQESVSDYKKRRKDLETIFTSKDRNEIIEVMSIYNAQYIYVNNFEASFFNISLDMLNNSFTELTRNEYAHVFRI